MSEGAVSVFERRPTQTKTIFILTGSLIVQLNNISTFNLHMLEQLTISPNTWHSYKTAGEPVKILEIIYSS